MKYREQDFSVSTYVAERTLVAVRVGVRVTHTPTGEFETSSDMRSDHANKGIAWTRLARKLAMMPEPTPNPVIPVKRSLLDEISNALLWASQECGHATAYDLHKQIESLLE